jgi:hypothetical protein
VTTKAPTSYHADCEAVSGENRGFLYQTVEETLPGYTLTAIAAIYSSQMPSPLLLLLLLLSLTTLVLKLALVSFGV